MDLGAIQAFLVVADYDNDGHDKNIIWSGDDCDDSESRVYPGAPEVCDGIDNQCAGDAGFGQVDEGCGSCADLDGDGRGSSCAAGPDCDDLDINNWNSCLTCSDMDGDAYFSECDDYVVIAGPDCDDLEILVYPGAPELCDGIDNNCAGGIDEGCPPPGMTALAAGCFNMGDLSGELDERPIHNVCLPAFNMDTHEATNAEYAACVSGGGCTAPASSSSFSRGSYFGNATYNNFPVVNVNWNQAAAYCSWAGKRLPTEAEWEYAARGGLSGNIYPWGNTYTWCVDGNFDFCLGDTSEVGTFPVNGYGLYDVGGNVWEWVNDYYSSTYYSTSPVNDPPGPPSGTNRILRGGSWYDELYVQRVSFRFNLDPTYTNYTIGFRCAQD